MLTTDSSAAEDNILQMERKYLIARLVQLLVVYVSRFFESDFACVDDYFRGCVAGADEGVEDLVEP